MENAAPRIRRATLAEQVEAHIRDLIVSGALGPGAFLPSAIKLAAEFGVSRAIVREAMKSLQAKGLIAVANGKRARVKPITSSVLVDFFYRFTRPHTQAAVELLELRRGLETQSATLAARRRTEEDLTEIWRLVREMEGKLGAPEAFLDVDVALHLAIASASKNRMLFHLVDSIREVLRDAMKEGLLSRSNSPDWHTIQEDHVRLVRFIEARDAEGAGLCMTAHVDDAIGSILAHTPVPLAALDEERG